MTEPEITVELDNSHNSNNSQHENGNNSNEENNEDLEATSGPENCDGSFGSLGSSLGNNDGDNESSSSGRKLFECDVCNMKFSNGANMRRHKMRHTGVKPYECKICQKRFFRKDHLAEHFTTHTKTLPYHCPICNRGFQRQIAMRAHFQNEHVGQNDMIKSCPLCSYRAGSMKNLRLHFFNSHGIDLDNPDPRMLTNPAVAAASLMSGGEVGVIATNNSSGIPPGGFPSDSGDSIGNRSADNATPPMHFLTPHVEISMADASSVTKAKLESSFASITMSSSSEKIEMNGDGTESPGSPQSGDSDVNPPSNSLTNEVSSFVPSVSLIPIKQEPEDEKSNGSTSSTPANPSLSNLMKSSPLKTLLREDLKRRTGLTFSTGPSRSSSPPESEWGSLKKNFSLKCLFCGILFPDQTLYFLHKGCHCESNPWRCNICGEQLFNVYEFNSHLLSKIHQ